MLICQATNTGNILDEAFLALLSFTRFVSLCSANEFEFSEKKTETKFNRVLLDDEFRQTSKKNTKISSEKSNKNAKKSHLIA